MKGKVKTMMYEIVKEFPNPMFFEEDAPYISLYQPTHRHSPKNKQGPLLFKNLIKQIEDSLQKDYTSKEIYSFMKPFYEIWSNKNFWDNTLDGLAVLANRKKCIVYRLPRPVQELAVVSNSLHIKPLIRVFQSADMYQLLGLNRNNFSLYEGNRYHIGEIEIDPSIPRTILEVLGNQYSESFHTQRSYGDSGGPAMYHGHGGRKDEIIKDTEKYFRYVDSFVLETYSRVSKSPLILVSLDEYHTVFRNISSNPYLLEKGIKASIDSLDTEEIREKAWEIMQPFYLARTTEIVQNFNNARANLSGSDDIEEIAQAAFENRVALVMIEDERIIPGKIDDSNGKIQLGNIKDPHCGDLLNDLAELVLKKRGEVVVLPEEKMPSKNGLAAIYRYRQI